MHERVFRGAVTPRLNFFGDIFQSFSNDFLNRIKAHSIDFSQSFNSFDNISKKYRDK